MAAFHMLPLVQDCMRMPWRLSCMLFSKTSIGGKPNLIKKLKKPLKPFQMFKTELAEELKAKNPSIQQSAISIAAKDRWKQIGEEEKKKYKSLYEDSLEEYMKEKEKYSQDSEGLAGYLKDIKQKKVDKIHFVKKLRGLRKPKKPLPPFFLFLESKRGSESGGTIESNKEFAKKMGQKWLDMPEAEKETYKLQYIENKKQFEKDLKKWEEDMIKQGNFDVIRMTTLANLNPDNTSDKNLKKF